MDNVATIGKEFTLPQLIKFVSGPVITRLLVSILQTLDDSLFISRFCGLDALAAFSLLMPVVFILDALGMLVSAVSTVCSIKMGKKKIKEAQSDFTTMSVATLFIGVIFVLFITIFEEPLFMVLGISGDLKELATTYLHIARVYMPLNLLNYIFSRFYVVAGRPKANVISSIISIFCNLFFDWLFIVRMGMGIRGTALANGISAIATTIFALIIYSNSKLEMHFVKPESKIIPLFKNIFKYGKAQTLTSLSVATNGFIANRVLLAIGGQQFVSAYTIVNNVQFLFMNCFFSLIGSVSPIVSYAYGEKNSNKLARILKQAMILITGLIGIIMILFLVGKKLIINLYLAPDAAIIVRDAVEKGMKIVPFGFIFFGYDVMTQELANALSNTKISMFLSLTENLFLQNALMIALPNIFGIDAVWFVFAISEFIMLFLCGYVIYANKDVYGYGKGHIATFVNK